MIIFDIGDAWNAAPPIERPACAAGGQEMRAK